MIKRPYFRLKPVLRVLGWLLSIVATIGIVWLIWNSVLVFPQEIVNQSLVGMPSGSAAPTQVDILKAENDVRATLIQTIGGFLLFVGAITSIWQIVSNTAASREELRLAREGQITERFTRAVDQLGSSLGNSGVNVEVRLGAIYALERIANESDVDYAPIIEVLAAYVRTNVRMSSAPKPVHGFVLRPRSDIQAAMTSIGRIRLYYLARSRKYGWQELNLRRTDLARVHLEGAHLEKARLRNANLQEAHLENTYLCNAGLQGANLFDADLQGANLEKAELHRTIFGQATLKGAVLREAEFEAVDLTNVQGLELAQVQEAYWDAKTIFPSHLSSHLPQQRRPPP
jgi:hypothetical protein